MAEAHTVFEIAFDVPAARREAFADWLAEWLLEWSTHEAVASFEAFENDVGRSPGVKFVFGFDSLADWTRFVESDEHAIAIEHLHGLTVNRDASLWHEASVSLDEESPIDDWLLEASS